MSTRDAEGPPDRRVSRDALRVLSTVTNYAVVQLPGRKYPGLVVQGDRLREWVELIRAGDSNSIESLTDALTTSLNEYVRVSREHGYE
jgi:hypothetical protein